MATEFQYYDKRRHIQGPDQARAEECENSRFITPNALPRENVVKYGEGLET